MSDISHEAAHTGPIKTPKQLLMMVFFAFVGPILIIIELLRVAKRRVDNAASAASTASAASAAPNPPSSRSDPD